jgi:NAD(P)-dependent dehydrogenase (short-subunit alcohol dehydrogenase family)
MTNSTHASLEGKIALVTGGGRGLGLEISRQLALLGAHVLIGARIKSHASDVVSDLQAQGLSAEAIQLDITNADDRANAYFNTKTNHGKLDILINNAGILLDSRDGGTPAFREPSEALPEVLRETFETNFFAPIFLTQTLFPLLRLSSAARVVNISSIRGSLTYLSDPKSPVYPIRALGYDTSKAALNAFTILIAEELRGTPIKINAIHPGWLQTKMGGDQATNSINEGAQSAVHYATLDEGGPTGGFFYLDQRLPW